MRMGSFILFFLKRQVINTKIQSENYSLFLEPLNLLLAPPDSALPNQASPNQFRFVADDEHGYFF